MKRKDGPRLGLYVREEKKDGYYHVIGYVVTIDAMEKIRNASDELINGMYLNNLEISSQSELNGRRLYAWEVRYKPYVVDLDDANRMVKTLRAIDQRVRKLHDRWGRPVTFGQFLSRVAAAVGADAFVWRVGPAASGWPNYDESRHQIVSVADGVATVDHWVERWANEGKEEPSP